MDGYDGLPGAKGDKGSRGMAGYNGAKVNVGLWYDFDLKMLFYTDNSNKIG